MESSLILARWPFSPFATALAAGALFAFCLTLLKRQKPPKRRHSAPARLGDLPRDPEGASNLYRTASESFLNRTETGTTIHQRLIAAPSISNFPAFDGRVQVPSSFHLSRFPFPERPYSFSDDLINIEKQFHRLYDFPLQRRRRKGHSSLPNFGIVSGLGTPPFPGFIPLSKHLSPFRSSGSLTRRWKSVSLVEPDRRRSPSPIKTVHERKFNFYSDSVLLPGTMSFRKKCYSTAFEFSRFRATFCASIRGLSTEPRSNLLSVPSISVRKSESIPTELSRLMEEVNDSNGSENGIDSVKRNGMDSYTDSSSSRYKTELNNSKGNGVVYSIALGNATYSPSSNLNPRERFSSAELDEEESSCSDTERIDSSPYNRSSIFNANKQMDLVEMDEENSFELTERSESSFVVSSELESVILKDEAYETIESESSEKPIERGMLCGSVPSTATGCFVSKVDSASSANKTSGNALGLRRRKTDVESSDDDDLVKAKSKLFSLSKDSSAECSKEEDASEYESLKSDREGRNLDDSTTDSYYSILEKSENLLRKDSTEDELDSSADFLTPVSESANYKVLYESLDEECLSIDEYVELSSSKTRECDNESADSVLIRNVGIICGALESYSNLERSRLESLGSEETLVNSSLERTRLESLGSEEVLVNSSLERTRLDSLGGEEVLVNSSKERTRLESEETFVNSNLEKKRLESLGSEETFVNWNLEKTRLESLGSEETLGNSNLEKRKLESLGREETLVNSSLEGKKLDSLESEKEMVSKKTDDDARGVRIDVKKKPPTKGVVQCLSKDEEVKIKEFRVKYGSGKEVLYEAVENNVAVKISSDPLGGARQKTPKTEVRSISAQRGEERAKIRSFASEKSSRREDTEQAPVFCQGVVSIDLSVRARPAIDGRLARFQGGDNAKREPIEQRSDVIRGERGRTSGGGQMERGLAPERTRVTSDVRVGDDLRVVSSLWSTDETTVVSDVWTEERGDVKVVIQDMWSEKDDRRKNREKLKMDWRTDDSFDVLTADFHPVATPERADEFRPTFEEFMPEEGGGLNAAIRELETLSGADSPRRVNRLLGLLKRDDERRKTARPVPEDPDGEWDRILGDLLRSVSELELARRRIDCSAAAAGADGAAAPAAPHSAMDGAEESSKGETPTKVKSLRFKLDPDVFDVPSDDSFYDEPVRLVSVHASVVPAGQKNVARPVGIDLRVRLTDSSKRSHGGTTPPAQAKRRSPVADPRSLGWCQELSPVTENVDWRETFTPVKEIPKTPEQPPKPNGILKTPSPKVENATPRDAANPFKGEMTNGHSKLAEKPALPPKPQLTTNGFHAPKKLSLPRKKFVPDPEAIERITGYKGALTKPPLPPAFQSKPTPPLTRLNRAEIARKQYLDNRAHLSAPKTTQDSTKKFQQFLTQAQSDRARIVTSVPDLNAIEKAVSEKWAKERGALRASPAKEEEDDHHRGVSSSSRGSTPDDAWASYVQSFRKSIGGRRSQSLSYLETDVDLLVTDEEEDKWRSSSALDSEEDHPDDSDLGEELADDLGRTRSEHELRIQRSLQSLPLPDWYKKSDKQKTGFILKSSAEKEKRGWAAAKSLASSTSSLASCGLRRPLRSLRSSRENIPWSRGSPDGPALSLALAKAFREPYLGWRARTSTTSSGVSSSSRTSPCGGGTDVSLDGGVATTDVSFDGEDAFGRTTSSSPCFGGHPDDTGADAITVSMDTEGDDHSLKPPTAEDTCDDIVNMSMDTLDNLSSTDNTTSTSTSKQHDSNHVVVSTSLKEANLKRYSYSRSIYHSEWDDDGQESRGEVDRKVKESVQEEGEDDPSSDHKVIWIESSFVGSRTTTSIVVLPEEQQGNHLERPASR